MANYTLDTGKKYIKDIFASDCFYNIPEYQRPYVWSSDQITALLEDLTNAMDHSKNKEYFLGCMVWNTKKIKEVNLTYTCQDILDGQQRFISIYLLQGVLRDLSDRDDLKNIVKERIQQKANPFEGTPERSRIEFEVRNDKAFLDLFLIEEGGTLQTNELTSYVKDIDAGTSVINMAAAILCMHTWWRKKLDELSESDRQKYIYDFYVFFSTKVLALYLATPDNLDDAYNLFTVLNSRGIQLRASDILRAQNLREISDDKQRKYFANQWEKYENTLANPYKSFDDFLWAFVYIKMKYSSDDNQSLIKAFDFMYTKKMLEKGRSTFESIGKYVKHFQAIFLPQNHLFQGDEDLLFVNLNFILTSTFGNAYVAPLMHYRECFGDYRITEFLLKMDNLLSIIWLTNGRSAQFRIFTMLRRMDDILRENINKISSADIFLKEPIFLYDYKDDKAATALDINAFYELLAQEEWGSFNGTRSNKTRYLLLKLDLIRSGSGTQLSYNKSLSSIEHLMPQHIDKEYWTVDDNEHKTWLHRLGNIVLIDRKKNSSLSNLDFSSKRVKYQGAIESRANTNYIFMSYRTWNIADILKNHSDMISLLKDYYQGNSLAALKNIRDALNTGKAVTQLK